MKTREGNTERRIALVSGAMGYLGKAISKKLAEDDMTVVLLTNQSSKEDTLSFIKTLKGTGHKTYHCDLESNSEFSTIIQQIEKEIGVPFVCVHAAGLKPDRKKLLETTFSEMERQCKINILGSFNFLSQCGKILQRQKKGVLIGITTIGIISPEFGRGLGGYIPAKWATQGILTMLREELKSSNIRVYSLAPGFMPGGMNNDIPMAFKEMARLKNPYKKNTTDLDIANKISYLCSDVAIGEKTFTHIVAEEYQK